MAVNEQIIDIHEVEPQPSFPPPLNYTYAECPPKVIVIKHLANNDSTLNINQFVYFFDSWVNGRLYLTPDAVRDLIIHPNMRWPAEYDFLRMAGGEYK